MTSSVFNAPKSKLDTFQAIVDKLPSMYVHIVDASFDTVQSADLLTYCAICKFWKGSNLHCVVYNLKFSRYVDLIRKSWSMRSEPEELEYIRIFSETAKFLIISNMDYMNFGEFESQTLLNLLAFRQSQDVSTVIVSPPIESLVSTKPSVFFNTLKQKLMSTLRAQVGGRA